MPGSGDYLYYQKINSAKVTDVVLAATDSGKDNVIVVKSANHQLFIQKISYSVVTAGTAVTFQDDNGTPVKIAVVPASQASPVLFDFGPKGRALTVGKNLDISNAAGPAGDIHIEAYEKLGNVLGLNYLSGASLQ